MRNVRQARQCMFSRRTKQTILLVAVQLTLMKFTGTLFPAAPSANPALHWIKGVAFWLVGLVMKEADVFNLRRCNRRIHMYTCESPELLN